VNVTSVLDDQTKHIAYIIAQTLQRGATTVEPTQEAQDEWVATIRKLSLTNRAFQEACTPGYYNNEGGRRTGALNGETPDRLPRATPPSAG
jgi:cyclohexanone monooxygenase